MIEPWIGSATILISFAAAYALGECLTALLRIESATRFAVGGAWASVWIGWFVANGVYECTLWIHAASTLYVGQLLYAVSACGGALLLWRRARASKHAACAARSYRSIEAPQRPKIEFLWYLVAAACCLFFAGPGLAGVDAIEVYQLKARALHEGTLDALAPRTAGSSHPLLLSSSVAWNAALRGSVCESMQVLHSISAWLWAACIFTRALHLRISAGVANCASLAFALGPAWIALAPRGEADPALVAALLASSVAWIDGRRNARVLAIVFAALAAAAKNEALAWASIGIIVYVAGRAPFPNFEPCARRWRHAAWAILAFAFLRTPAFVVRMRWGTFVEHVDAMRLDAEIDLLYLFSRGAPILEALGKAGCSAASGFAAPLWIFALALGWGRRVPGQRLALAMGYAWFAIVVAGMLAGSYDAAWQAQVAAARVWLQASPWLFITLALGWMARDERVLVSRCANEVQKNEGSHHGPGNSPCQDHVGPGKSAGVVRAVP